MFDSPVYEVVTPVLMSLGGVWCPWWASFGSPPWGGRIVQELGRVVCVCFFGGSPSQRIMTSDFVGCHVSSRVSETFSNSSPVLP